MYLFYYSEMNYQSYILIRYQWCILIGVTNHVFLYVVTNHVFWNVLPITYFEMCYQSRIFVLPIMYSGMSYLKLNFLLGIFCVRSIAVYIKPSTYSLLSCVCGSVGPGRMINLLYFISSCGFSWSDASLIVLDKWCPMSNLLTRMNYFWTDN